MIIRDDASGVIGSARTLLFVPGDRPDRFDKAMAAGADAVILDLEDAVAPSAKNAARAAVARWVAHNPAVVLRINAAGTEWFESDLALCKSADVMGILLPKAVAGETLGRVAALRPTIALIESARGILDLPAVAATEGVTRLAFGAIDLALELNTATCGSVFDSFRLQMVVASCAAGLPAPIDGVTRNFREPAVVAHDVAHSRALGMTGKLCIHPGQIDPTHVALRPGSEELALARRIIAADAAALGGAVSLDGLMIDKPVVQRARTLLRYAL